jgi:hypothetical protein
MVVVQPPDRNSSFLMVAIVVALLLAGVGGAFWILRSHPAPKAAPHQPCEPLGSSGPSSAPAGQLDAGDWLVTVSSVHVASTLPNDKGVESFQLPANLVYLIVDAKLQNQHPGKEAELSSSMFALVCEDGTVNTPDGLDQGKGFCEVCSFDLGLSDESLSWSFAFKIDQGWTDQAFRLTYGAAEGIALPAAAA